MLSVSLLLHFFVFPSSARREYDEAVDFYLDAEYRSEYNMVTLGLFCVGSVAGALLEIEYDNSALCFTSAESSADELEFSCSLGDTGIVRVLFDGTENSACDGRLALLCFSLAEGAVGSFTFDLRCPDPESVFGIDGDIFYTVPAELYGCFLSIPPSEPDAEYMGFYVDGEDKLCFVGKGNLPDRGFEVCTVDPMKGAVDKYTLTPEPLTGLEDHPDESFFASEFILPRDSLMLCIFVRAFEDRDGVRLYGEEEIHFFYKGIYTEFDENLNRRLTVGSELIKKGIC